MSEHIIINFCPTGMKPMPSDNSSVPIHPAEIIEQTHEAYELGITIAHLHAREADGTPTWRGDIYLKIFEGVRKHCPDLVICASSSGRRWTEFEKRAEVLSLHPDMCSLTMSSLNFADGASLNNPDMIIRLAEAMCAKGVTPELEIFDLGMINYAQYLIRKGIVKGPGYWNLLFGNLAGMQADPASMAAALQMIPPGALIAFGGIGHQQLRANTIAMSLGLGVRVGLEDNLWMDEQRKEPASNLTLLRRIHELLELLCKRHMPAAMFGQMGHYNPNR
jgi:3-keto-5-aminohexanoate cleavage enzyme